MKKKIRRLKIGKFEPLNDHLIWIVAVLGILIFQALPGLRILDDAFITYRYARNIVSGMGYVYNPGEFVQGTTTPLFTLILVLFSFFVGSERIPIISFCIALVSDILNVWLLFRVGKFITKQKLVAFLMAIVFLLQPLRINVAEGGMETSLFILVMLAMYDFYILEKNQTLAAIFGGLLILIRPDGVLAVLPVLIHLWWKNRQSALKPTIIGVLILAPWYVWATLYFGNPFPFSIFAKMITYKSYSPIETLIFLLTFLGTGTLGPYQDLRIILPGLLMTTFLIIIGIRWLWNNNRDGIIIVLYPILYFIFMMINHAPLFFSWYYPPLIPGFLLAIFCAYMEMTSNLLNNVRVRGIILGVFVFLLIFIPYLFIRSFPGWSDARDIEMLYNEASSSIHFQAKDKLVFSPDIGVIGWNLENSRIFDPIGLVSPQSLDYRNVQIDSSERYLYLINEFKPDFVFARDNFLLYLTKDSGFLEKYKIIWQKEFHKNIVTIYQRK